MNTIKSISPPKPRPALFLVNEPSYANDVRALHRIGWNTSVIARYLSADLDVPLHQVRFKIKRLTAHIPQLLFLN